ncbi:MAG: class I SAM-dependent methyltransferase [Desulfuromonadaceae bacterium]
MTITGNRQESDAGQNINTDSTYNKAKILNASGNIIGALRLMENIPEVNRSIPGLNYFHSQLLNYIGRHEEALEAARAELVITPENSDAISFINEISKAIERPPKINLPNEARDWKTSLPHKTLLDIQNACHNYTYRGIPMIKNPFDFAIYPLLIWNAKPKTIIEIGSKNGGSAIWMGDMFDNYGIDGHIYSIDIIKVKKISHPRVTFLEGNGRALHETLSPQFFESLPRPLLVIEDADHSYETSKHVLQLFHQHLMPDEYIVIEDGIISDLAQDPDCNSGPHRAIKEFLAEHRGEYEIDGDYCDYFGYNLTWCTNGFLKKNASSNKNPLLDVRTLHQQALSLIHAENFIQAFEVLNQAKTLKQPFEGLDYLRALCFLQQNQTGNAVVALREELRFFPKSKDAQELLDKTFEPQQSPAIVVDDEFRNILQVIRPYTMLSDERLYSLFNLAKSICEKNIAGNFVECGVAGGGSSALLAYVIKRYSRLPRKLFAFDSFCGLPQPTSEDSHCGINASECGWGAGTCAAPESSVREACAKLDAENMLTTVKGYFEETLPNMRDWVGMIAFLHLDGDWYDSTRTILRNLYDRLVNDAVLQVDDYGYWDGCRKALHEFEAERNIYFALTKIDATGVWFSKPDTFLRNPQLSADLVNEFITDDPVGHGIESQMSSNERFQLYYAVRQLLPKTARLTRFIEIGSYAGGSFYEICMAFQRNGVVYQGIAVEPAGQQQFHEIIKLFSNNAIHLPFYSHDAAKLLELILGQGNKPDFILIDGGHTYQDVRQDICDYYPLLAPGGIMMFHDYLPPLNDRNREFIYAHHANTEPGIRKACQEIMEQDYGLEPLSLPLLYPNDPSQTQTHMPIIPDVYSTIRAYRKPG